MEFVQLEHESVITQVTEVTVSMKPDEACEGIKGGCKSAALVSMTSQTSASITYEASESRFLAK